MRTRIVLVVVAVAVGLTLLATGALAGSNNHPGNHPVGKGKKNKESRALFAVLRGRNEINAQGNKGAGDPDGRGSFTAIVDGNQLCFGITVTNLDTPSAAHIHKGKRNENGSIVVPLTQPNAGDPGASSGCVTVDTTLAQDILKHPHNYYANVHTSAFPNGAARGQLFGKSR